LVVAVEDELEAGVVVEALVVPAEAAAVDYLVVSVLEDPVLVGAGAGCVALAVPPTSITSMLFYKPSISP
jgi:hypothetical protein